MILTAREAIAEMIATASHSHQNCALPTDLTRWAAAIEAELDAREETRQSKAAMGDSLLFRIKGWIGSAAWRVFLWANETNAEDYWSYIYEQERARLRRTGGTDAGE